MNTDRLKRKGKYWMGEQRKVGERIPRKRRGGREGVPANWNEGMRK